MKNKYVVMGMVIIIVVAVIWGVYEVGNSIMFKNGGDVMTREHIETIERIKNIDNKEIRRITIEQYIQMHRITIDEANILY